MLRFLPGNAQHIGGRAEQQDSFAFSDPADKNFTSHAGLLAVVADGMGGLDGGREASSTGVAALLESYNFKAPQEPIPDALRRALNAANLAIKSVCRERGNAEGETGSTLAAAVLHNESLYWISVGDTRLYLLRDGRLVQVNADHNYGATILREVAAGRSARDQIRNDPRAPQLTSYLGLTEIPEVDASIRPFPLRSGDVVIACTDGVYRTLDSDEIANAFRIGNPFAACDTVETTTIEKRREHQDNLTIIAVDCADGRTAPGRKNMRSQWGMFVTKAVICFELCVAVYLAGAYIRQHRGVLIHLVQSRPTTIKAPSETEHFTTPPTHDPLIAPRAQIPSTNDAKSTHVKKQR
jgi:PPM family protein phosphatase